MNFQIQARAKGLICLGMGFIRYSCDITVKLDDLSIIAEAKVYYLSNCLRSYDYVKSQQASEIERPKIKLDLEFAKHYCRNNDLGERDIDLIYDELREIDVLKNLWGQA